VLALVRFAFALLALGPATVLMGATLPSLTRYLSRDAGHLSAAFGRLYAANTIGAILGTAAAGLVLIELLGLMGTLIVGAGCSAIAGLVALALSRRGLAGRTSAHGSRGQVVEAVTEDSPAQPLALDIAVDTRRRIALLVAFVSGLTSLGYQTLWTRLLANGTGNYTYVFTGILTFFLIGLAVGAVAFSILRPRLRRPIATLALAQTAVAVFAALGVWLLLATGAEASLYVSIPSVVLPATVVMGLSFPLASALIASDDAHVGSDSGTLLAANTLGGITCTFIIPFFVIPAIGAPTAVGVLALVNLALAATLAVVGGGPAATRRFALAINGAFAALLTVALVTGAVFRDPTVVRLSRLAGAELFATAEDEIASVQAGQIGGHRQLWVTGTSMTLLTVDAKLMPILPLAVHPEARDMLVVAFGMGSSYRAGLIAGLTVDAVELVPSVPTMYGYFYEDADTYANHPNGRIIIADGRNYVELTEKTYDIVMTDPPPPIESAGVSVIAGRDYYVAAKRKLNPGGVMMQWMPYGQRLDEFQAQVRTFADVWPEVLIAFGPGGYGFFMLGSERPVAFSPGTLKAAIARPGVYEDLSSAFDSPDLSREEWPDFIRSLVWKEGDEVRAFAGQGPLITDDQPFPEYFLLRRMFGAESPTISRQLLQSLS